MKSRLKIFLDNVKRVLLGIGGAFILASFTVLLISPDIVSEFLLDVSFSLRFIIIAVLYGIIGFVIYRRYKASQPTIPVIKEDRSVAKETVKPGDTVQKNESVKPPDRLVTPDIPKSKPDLTSDKIPVGDVSDDVPDDDEFWKFLNSTTKKD